MFRSRRNGPANYAPTAFRCQESISQEKGLLLSIQAKAGEHIAHFRDSTAPGLAETTREVFSGAVDDLRNSLEDLARSRGCGVQYMLGEQSVRAVCESSQCPFYPNGPETA